jgi:heme/copper-type cytochrome/quinol oxidase subunit 3
MANGDAAFAPQFDDAEQQRTASNLGIWIFLATEILFFGVLFAGVFRNYSARMPISQSRDSRVSSVP